MKTIAKIITGILLIGFSATNTIADPMIKNDTIKLIINGDTTKVADFDKLEGMDNVPDMDSIMNEVEKSLDEMESDMEDIRIEEKGDKKIIIIKNKDGKVVNKITVKNKDGENEKELEVEIEKDDSDKMAFGFMSPSIGMNNYLEDGNFPSGDELYYVKPFGSWSFALESGWRYYPTTWLSLDVSADIMWYNFKLQDKNVVTDESTNIEGKPVIEYVENSEYEEGDNDAIRSKLTVSYLDVNLMPVFHIGKLESGINKRPVRVGIGGYAGYRIGAHTKNVWDEDGQKRKSKNYDNFYLNNFRYGVKAMIGVKEFNLFMNYDINTLYEESKGPEGKDLNAFSFGVRFVI